MNSLGQNDSKKSVLIKTLTYDFFPENIEDIERAYDEQPNPSAIECRNQRMIKKNQNQESILNYFLEANEYSITEPPNLISETEQDILQKHQSLDLDNLDYAETRDIGETKQESPLGVTDSPCEAITKNSHLGQTTNLKAIPAPLLECDNESLPEM
jgi:pantothenate synthetase